MTKKVSEMKSDEIKEAVRDAYSRVAEESKSGQGQTSSCCGPQERVKDDEESQ
ncbi:MAG: hypothetical protein ACFFDM_05660 [Candidatus Thorarchaeota archaeon]